MLRVWRLPEPVTWVGPRPVKSVSCAERQNGTLPRERSLRGGGSSCWRRIETISEVGAKIQFLCDGQARPLILGKRIDAETGFTTHPRPRHPQESCSVHDPCTSRTTSRYAWAELDSNVDVSGDAYFAGCNSTRKSTVGGVAMWIGQFVKAWSKTYESFGLEQWRVRIGSGGESNDRSDGTAVDIERLLFVWPRGD